MHARRGLLAFWLEGKRMGKMPFRKSVGLWVVGHVVSWAISKPKYNIRTERCMHKKVYKSEFLKTEHTLTPITQIKEEHYKLVPNIWTFKMQTLNHANALPHVHRHQVWVNWQLALHFLLLTILQLHHLSAPLPPLVSNSSCLVTRCQPLCATCCTGLLYFSRYCTLRLKMFTFCVWFLCAICVKSIINLLQYSTLQLTVLVGYLG